MPKQERRSTAAPVRKITRAQLNREINAEKLRVVEWLTQKGGRTYVNVVLARSRRPRTLEVVEDEQA